MLRFGDRVGELYGCDPKTTNNRMELMAVIRGLEALKDVLAEMDREGVLAIGGMAVDGTRSTSLLAAAVQLLEEAEMAQQLFEGDLTA